MMNPQLSFGHLLRLLLQLGQGLLSNDLGRVNGSGSRAGSVLLAASVELRDDCLVLDLDVLLNAISKETQGLDGA